MAENKVAQSSSKNAADEQHTIESELILVDDDRLHSLQARPPFPTYLRKLWARRHFIWTQARSGALSSGRGMFLGQLWIFLNPALQVAVFAFVFGVLLNVSRGIDNFVGFLALGVIFFGFVSGGLSAGSGLIQSSRNLISSFQFPKASLAFSATIKRAIDNLAPALLAVIGCILFQLEEPLHWTIVFVVPLYFLVHVFGLGATLIGARMTAFVPDVKALIRVLTRVLFFLSGVFYSVERFATQPVIQEIMLANPIYQFLRAVRNSVMLGVVPTWQEWLYLSIWSFGLLIVGFVFFWRAEARYSSVK